VLQSSENHQWTYDGMIVHTLFRLVKSGRPTEADFISNYALGLPLRHDTPETRRLWTGLSAFDTESRARRMGRRYPWLGSYIAELLIPADAGIRWERTTATRGHFTIWGSAADVLACVVRVVPI
jgi:hypothetical protein